MKLNDSVYNILKWVLMIVVPAFITLISTLGTIYGWDTKTLTLTIAAVATFLGVITGISNSNYYHSDDKTEA
jgi:hypothetical protein